MIGAFPLLEGKVLFGLYPLVVVMLLAWVLRDAGLGAVKVERSRNMVEAIKKAGGEPKYTEYKGVGHDSWTATYKDPAVMEWLFAQKR